MVGGICVSGMVRVIGGGVWRGVIFDRHNIHHFAGNHLYNTSGILPPLTGSASRRHLLPRKDTTNREIKGDQNTNERVGRIFA